MRALDAQKTDGVPFEVIVVDNGSRSMPEAACAAFEGVRLVREDTPGPGPARNRGARLARGRILAFVDADCVADAGWVEGIAKVLNRRPDVDFIGGEVRVAWVDPRRPTAVEAYERVFSYRNRIYVEQHGYAATGNMAVRASVFEAVGPFGGITTMEDTEWGKRATAQGYRVVYTPDVRVFTPACRSYAELLRRYNRHVAHEFGERRDGPIGTAKWIARAMVIAASPVVELLRLSRWRELPDWRSRWLAWLVLARLRLFRAGRMLTLMTSNDATQVVGRWNRDDAPTGHTIGTVGGE